MTDEKTNEQTNDESALTTAPAGALAAFGGLDALAAQLEASATDVNAELNEEEGSGVVEFMTFKKFGEEGDLSPWMYGREDVEVHPDAEWIVDPTTMEHGWMGFQLSPKGKPQKGKKPDKLFTSWTTRFPERPEDMPWLHRAFKWRAICRKSPIDDQVGAYVENADWRRMKEGYAELERALRDRVQQAKTAAAAGNVEQAKQLMDTAYPVIRFRFKLGVDVGANGKHNKGIIEHIGWSAPVVVERDDDVEDESDNVEEALEKAEVPETARRRRRA